LDDSLNSSRFQRIVHLVNRCRLKRSTQHLANQSSGGARLFVDDELLGSTNDLYASEDEATLVGVFAHNDVEAFVKPSKKLEVSIRVNAEWVTGDKAYAVASD
jgi:hypothetical protein